MNIAAKELKPGDHLIVKGIPCTVQQSGPALTDPELIIISWRDSGGQLRHGRAGSDSPISIQEGQ